MSIVCTVVSDRAELWPCSYGVMSNVGGLGSLDWEEGLRMPRENVRHHERSNCALDRESELIIWTLHAYRCHLALSVLLMHRDGVRYRLRCIVMACGTYRLRRYLR